MLNYGEGERKIYIRKFEKESNKAALLAVYNTGGNWKGMLSELNILLKTAYRWLDASNDFPDRRGRPPGGKITEEHLQFFTEKVNANPRITLQELKARFNVSFPGITLCNETVRKALGRCLFTIKLLRFESENANLSYK